MKQVISLMVILLLGAAGLACERRPPPGTERGPCRGDDTCDSHLACLSNTCVRLPGAGEFQAKLEQGEETPPAPTSRAPHSAQIELLEQKTGWDFSYNRSLLVPQIDFKIRNVSGQRITARFRADFYAIESGQKTLLETAQDMTSLEPSVFGNVSLYCSNYGMRVSQLALDYIAARPRNTVVEVAYDAPGGPVKLPPIFIDSIRFSEARPTSMAASQELEPNPKTGRNPSPGVRREEGADRVRPAIVASPSLGARENLESIAPEAMSVTVSSIMSPFDSFRFDSSMLVDEDLGTSWQPSRGGAREAAWVRVEFAKEVTLARLDIANGFQRMDSKFGDLFLENSRLLRALLVFDDGAEREISFDPSERGFVSIEFPRQRTKYFVLKVLDVKKGDKWDDLAISEIRIFAAAGRSE